MKPELQESLEEINYLNEYYSAHAEAVGKRFREAHPNVPPLVQQVLWGLVGAAGTAVFTPLFFWGATLSGCLFMAVPGGILCFLAVRDVFYAR